MLNTYTTHAPKQSTIISVGLLQSEKSNTHAEICENKVIDGIRAMRTSQWHVESIRENKFEWNRINIKMHH